MERNEVSAHEVRVYLAFAGEPQRWFSSAEMATAAGVAGRTARAHALKLVKLGIVDQAEVFPAHRYRLSTKAAKRNRGYVDRLAAAAEVLGLSKKETAQ